ncbi:SpoIIE family protein phosphatase [Streptomyces sp. MP131-18]|uniref:SpoIIE family protein phosphatase n=1 Tax=Streptomyces sp. MP131-18 TaxID=1857892 RepID=UPI00097BDFE2|nr:SpoIIE family protein phosphatase [Streptomyces sp. MP131-18]ONK13016.1 Phosphoserine phosphatase RsbU [Streptomyces sp. MP131-18]
MAGLSPSRADLLDPPLVRALRKTGAYGAGIYLLAPGERVLRLAVTSGLPRRFIGDWLRVPVDAGEPLGDAVENRRLVWLGVREMERRYARPDDVTPYPLAAAFVPILRGDTCWGAIALIWPGNHPDELARDERDIIDDTTTRLADLLAGAEREGRPVRASEEPHVLVRPRARTPGHEEAQAAAGFAERLPEGCWALDLDGRLTYVSGSAAKLVGADVTELLGARPWDALPWLSDPVFEDRYRAALFSRQPGSFTALKPPERWLRFQLYPDAFGISVRITPASAAPGARAVSEARAAPTRAGALYHMMQLATVLTEAVSVRDVVDLVASQIMPALDAQGLLMFVAEGGRLRALGHRGYRAEAVAHFDGASLTPATTPAARVLADGAPAFYPSPEALAAHFPGLPELSGKSAWAMLPLIATGRTVGCCVISYERPREFSPEERGIMSSLAGLIAQALERARLHDTRHHLARRLQAGLLPRVLPRVPGLDVAARYLPASHGMEIGGDFYDLIRLDEDGSGTVSVAAAIGDVQGHNVTAAALMGQVRTAVHATAGEPPGEVLARANRLLTDLDPGLFTSCLYVQLDLSARRLSLSTAGHPPPLVRYPDGRVVALEVPPGPLLGIEPDAAYPATETGLPEGAVLLLYTDGLIERPGIDIGDAIAELAAQLGGAPSGRPMDELADGLLRHARQTESRSDDIALLLLSPVS